MAKVGGVFLVLASQRGFESLVGPVPDRWRGRFRFVKPGRARRIRSLLPDCRLVVSKNYPRPDLNRWIFEARRRAIPTLLVVDGPLEWANLYANPSLARLGRGSSRGLFEPIAHDGVACIGPAQAHWIEQQNAERGLTLMSYANRRILSSPSATAESPRNEPGDALARGSGGDAPSRRDVRDPQLDFLLTTAKTPYFDAAEKASLMRALADCAAALERGGHSTLVRVFDPELRAAIEAALPSARFETDDSFAAALARVRCVIGTPSSVLLEAMAQGRPTATLMFRDGPLFYQTGWLLGAHTDWTAGLDSMLAAAPERMDLQRRTLAEQLSDEDFFALCDRIEAGDVLTAPRELDARDLEFENRVLRRLVGWQVGWLAPLARWLSRDRGSGAR